MTYLELMHRISQMTEEDQKKPVVCYSITTGKLTLAVRTGEINHPELTEEKHSLNYGDPVIVH